MVTDYLKQCRYSYDKLKSHLYIINGSDNIIIDRNDESQYYISGVNLSEVIFVSGFNISYTEDESLDERYKFQKTLKISVNGKADIDSFTGDLYAVIETNDGTKYLVNPDYPLKLTYEFNLSEGVNQTDITLQTPSNFPALEFVGDGLENAPECKHYALNGITELYLIEADYAVYVSTDNKLNLTSDLKKVEFNDLSCSLQEEYDGNKVIDTLKFDITLDDYKTSWQYRLLEFKDNLYRAVVFSKDDYKYYVGFNYGLQPSYTINSSSSDEFNTVTVTLTESSVNGCFKKYDALHIVDSNKSWEYIRYLDGNQAYLCNMSHGCGWAEVFVMAEVDYFGNRTGRYKVLEDIYNGLYNQTDPDIDYSYYEERYAWLIRYNVIGSFEDDYPNGWFPTVECACYQPGNACQLNTDMPFNIEFNGTGSKTFTLAANCNWSITDIPTGISISPTTGAADTNYTITVTNSSETIRQDAFKLSCCSSVNYFSINVIEDSPCIDERYKYIDCNGQTVSFNIKEGCDFTVDYIDNGLSHYVSDNVLYVNVPSNYSPASKTYYIYGMCCGGLTELRIIQSQQYTVWLEDGYACSAGTKYVNETLWSGTSYTKMDKTEISRLGEEIEQNSPDCRSIESFKLIGYICIDGSKYELYRRYLSWDDGETWEEQIEVKLGNWIEDESDFCQDIQEKWVLTDEFICANLEE